MSRIDRYTAAATPVAAVPVSGSADQIPYMSQQQPPSPTSSMRTNATSSTMPTESGAPSYHQFPAQAARIPTSQSQIQLDHTGHVHGNPLQHTKSRDHARTNSSTVTSPYLASTNRDNSWPVEGFSDLHLSGSEPRIFPGLVSRPQRKDSLVRKSSMNETDEHFNTTYSRKITTPQGVHGAVEEESDREMEEASGTNE
jgi:AMP deaminase